MSTILRIPNDCALSVSRFLETDGWRSMSLTCKPLYNALQTDAFAREIPVKALQKEQDRQKSSKFTFIREVFGGIRNFQNLPEVIADDFHFQNMHLMSLPLSMMKKYKWSMARSQINENIMVLFLRLKDLTPSLRLPPEDILEAWRFEIRPNREVYPYRQRMEWEPTPSFWYKLYLFSLGRKYTPDITGLGTNLFPNHVEYLKRLIRNENCGSFRMRPQEGPRTTLMNGREVSTVSLVKEKKNWCSLSFLGSWIIDLRDLL